MEIDINGETIHKCGKIILSDAALHGIKGVTKEKPVYSEEYKKLQEAADRMIEADHDRYRRAYYEAKNYLGGKSR